MNQTQQTNNFITPVSLPAFQHYNEIIKESLREDKGRFNTIYNREDGGRKSAKTTQSIRFGISMVLLHPNNADFYLYRWLKGEDADELFEEVVQNTESILGRELIPRKEINWSKRRITINGNQIRVGGINSANKRKKVKAVGMKGAHGKNFLILLLEERYEFEDSEIIAIRHALRGYHKVINIEITNPHSLAYEYIKGLDDYMRHDEATLRNKGQQFKADIKNEDGTYKDTWTLTHYTNWRVNSFLTKADIDSILWTHTVSKIKARVADYGMPAPEEGAIYAEEYEKIKIRETADMPTSYQQLTAGIDLGHGTGKNSSATTMIVKGRGWNEERFTYAEYYHHNKNGYKSPTQKANEMIDLIVGLSKQHRFRNMKADGLEVNCEWDDAFIDIFERLIEERGLSDWLEINQTTKHAELTRIAIRKYVINTGRSYVDSSCKNYLNELQIQVWSETLRDRKTKRAKAEDADNHTTDADDYAECDYAYDVTEEDSYSILNK